MVWLIGCKGMLGTELSKQLSENKILWFGSDREVDITDAAALAKFAQSKNSDAGRTGAAVTNKAFPEKIEWVVNCAAYTAVDKAEEEKAAADAINKRGPENIARITRSLGAKMIHISTDYVFDGEANTPYVEDAPKNPQCVYGKTKLAGEEAVAKEMTQYYILRTSWLYGFEGGNFVYTMIKAMNKGQPLKVVSDQKGCPTCTTDLAATVIRIISSSQRAKSLFGKNSALPCGIYNFCGTGVTSWFDFANKIQELAKKYSRITAESPIEPCSTADYPTAAKRPTYSALDCSKIQHLLKLKIPTWQESLEKFIKSDRFKPL